MNENQTLKKLALNSIFDNVIEKLFVDILDLDFFEKSYLLSCAILLLNEYDKDQKNKAYLEFGYFIIMKYSLQYNDFAPLYDFSLNFGFYPISHVLSSRFPELRNSFLAEIAEINVDGLYKRNGIFETFEQNITREIILNDNSAEISYIAPTSFGKSRLILEHIRKIMHSQNKIVIIVPTKSLLSQTFKQVKEANFGRKILIHDEMYNNEDQFIAIFTQERALRLLGKTKIFFDIIYIDEAHKILERDNRSILLTRLLRTNRFLNSNQKVVYLSPFVVNSDNLQIDKDQSISEQRIRFNLKEPEIYEYRLDNGVYKYNRFQDKFYYLNSISNLYEYININKKKKSFVYLYSPRKIEQFTKRLCENMPEIEITSDIQIIIDNLSSYVHEEFSVISAIKHGVIYIHGKIPDSIKEYLEYKFSQISDISIIVANKVILEGINLPIDTLFVLNMTNLNTNNLVNLIGRVNRLNEIFKNDNVDLSMLLPKIHFVNSRELNRKNSKMSEKIRLLRNNLLNDEVLNPILLNYNIEKIKITDKEKFTQKSKEIISNEDQVFKYSNDPLVELKKNMIKLGIDLIFNLTDVFVQTIHSRLDLSKSNVDRNPENIVHIIWQIFIFGNEKSIIDEEFSRLENAEALAYYTYFLEVTRQRSLKHNINSEIEHFVKKANMENSLMYIGESYGEERYHSNNMKEKLVYIDLKKKDYRDLVNIAVVKLKIEDDFVNFKLSKFVTLMFDYGVISQEIYNKIIYGTSDTHKLEMIKMGMKMNVINKLIDDKQIDNISIDENFNLTSNNEFTDYLSNVDDFFSFELKKIFF